MQNAAARLVTGARRSDHIAPVLRQLHWLPVRQGSVLGPILFIMYTADLVSLIQQHCLSPHLYTDDTHLRCMCPIRRRLLAAVQRVTACLKSVADWMSTNRLQLNSDNTEFMWLTTARSQHRLPTSDPVRDLSVFIDQDLTMKTHVQRTASR